MEQQILERLDRIEAALSAPPKEYLNTAEAAAYVGVSSRTLNTWLADGSGPVAHRVGGRLIFSRDDLRAFLARHRGRDRT